VSGSPPPIAASRREAILDAALELFRRRGFHAVGIDEIGTAAGISGPGVYRHFPSKSSLLVALFDSITERMLDAAEEIQKADCPPEEALDRLVAFHAATAVQERGMVAVWLQDGRSLPAADEQRIRRRQAEYVGIWVAMLTRVRPELAPHEAETVVHAALGAVNSVALHDTDLPTPALERLLGAAARAVLAAA
jgi:AcrR family transcriptional regulator